MNFINTHKALILTFLISGMLVLLLFSLSITKTTDFITENYYEIQPPKASEIEKLETLKTLQNKDLKTNQAYNEDKEFKEMMRNFKSVNSFEEDDFTKPSELSLAESTKNPEAHTISNSPYNASQNYALKDSDREAFNKANAVLNVYSPKKEAQISKGNSESSVTFSLSNRSYIILPPPIYLCETAGKIVVNITVNSEGQVTDTYINSSSSSTNQCLIDTALDYAKHAVFSSAERHSQIGAITYYFQGKN